MRSVVLRLLQVIPSDSDENPIVEAIFRIGLYPRISCTYRCVIVSSSVVVRHFMKYGSCISATGTTGFVGCSADRYAQHRTVVSHELTLFGRNPERKQNEAGNAQLPSGDGQDKRSDHKQQGTENKEVCDHGRQVDSSKISGCDKTPHYEKCPVGKNRHGRRDCPDGSGAFADNLAKCNDSEN